jgi:hypothetical protein
LSLFFAPVFGRDHADVHGVATAIYEGKECGRIVGLESVWLENGDVDSYISDLGSYATQTPRQNGNVCSNGPITLAPNAFVKGDAHAGPDQSVAGASRVTGSTEPLDSLIVAPPVDPGPAASLNDNSQIPAGLLAGPDFVLEGNVTVPLPPGTYYINGDFRIGGGAGLNILGPTKIYVTGNVDIAGNGVTSGTPANLDFFPMGETARFAGDAAFSGAIYGPTTDVTIAGNGGLFGAVIGKTLTLQGNPSKIHYDEALTPVSQRFGRGKLVQ